jgi:N-acetylmuramic acid 6-phosphate etherase
MRDADQMGEDRTERPQLDLLATAELVEHLLTAEERVVPAARAQLEQLAAAADLVAERMAVGGRLVFAGAGTSGRLAFTQAAELPGTFGLDRERVRAVVAGGVDGTDDDEDDLALAESDLAELRLGPADVVLTVAASGRTPYTLLVAESARATGAAVVAVVNTTGSPLAALAEIAIEVDAGPEVLRDSTRLSAGTAQKVVLDALTTAAMVRLGRAHGDLMVDVVGANAKLRERQAAIVAEIAGTSTEVAAAALGACHGKARAAVVHLVLGLPPDEAAAHAGRFITLRHSLGPKP